MPAYYVMCISIPRTDEGVLEVWPVATVGELFAAQVHGCNTLVASGLLDDDDILIWRAWAVEDDGSRRPLTRLEEAALVATYEQAASTTHGRGVKATAYGRGEKAWITRFDDDSGP